MTAAIHGIGTALGPHRMTQEESTQLATEVICRTDSQARLLRRLYSMAGVEQRFLVVPFEMALEWVGKKPSDDPIATIGPYGATTAERMRLYQLHAPPLAASAVQEALDDAAVAPHEISHLVTVSCTGFGAPGVEHQLIQKLGLPPSVERINVGFMGCHGAVNGLRVAKAIAESVPASRVLLCAVELCSLHYQLVWNPQHIVANSLFSDGAAAVVVTNDRQKNAHCVINGTGSIVLPDSSDLMQWIIGEHGFEMTLSTGVPDQIRKSLQPWLSSWLSPRGIASSEDMVSWAIHPGGPRVIAAVEQSLGIDPHRTTPSRNVLANYGNMSSPTILFILKDLLNATHSTALPALALAFGPGLSAECALFTPS